MSAYTKAQAKEADTRLAEHYIKLYKVEDKVSSDLNMVAHALGAKFHYANRTRGFMSLDGRTPLTVDVALEKAAELKGTDRWRIQQGDKRVDQLRYTLSAQANIIATIQASEEEWSNHGRWARFFAVTGGHIHSSTSCSSLRPTTRIGWLPELAAETEKEAVEAYGSVMCTKCFPSAPVEWTVGKLKTQAQIDKESRSAERAAKKAEKDAKAIIDPRTGSALLDDDGREIKTERAASNAVLDRMFSLRWYGESHPSAQGWASYVDRALLALAVKKMTSEGITVTEDDAADKVNELRKEYQNKADKKYRKEIG